MQPPAAAIASPSPVLRIPVPVSPQPAPGMLPPATCSHSPMQLLAPFLIGFHVTSPYTAEDPVTSTAVSGYSCRAPPSSTSTPLWAHDSVVEATYTCIGVSALLAFEPLAEVAVPVELCNSIDMGLATYSDAIQPVKLWSLCSSAKQWGDWWHVAAFCGRGTWWYTAAGDGKGSS